jgi:hypothetical protein
MDRPAYYRDRAKHLRELANVTWQPRLELMLRDLARDYEEAAEEFEAGAKTGHPRAKFSEPYFIDPRASVIESRGALAGAAPMGALIN